MFKGPCNVPIIPNYAIYVFILSVILNKNTNRCNKWFDKLCVALYVKYCNLNDLQTIEMKINLYCLNNKCKICEIFTEVLEYWRTFSFQPSDVIINNFCVFLPQPWLIVSNVYFYWRHHCYKVYDLIFPPKQ